MEHLQGTLTPLVHAHAGRTQNNAPDKPVIIMITEIKNIPWLQSEKI